MSSNQRKSLRAPVDSAVLPIPLAVHVSAGERSMPSMGLHPIAIDTATFGESRSRIRPDFRECPAFENEFRFRLYTGAQFAIPDGNRS